MGMSAHELTLPKQLYNANKIQYNMFSMCFRIELGTSKRGVLAGSLTIGGTSIELDTSPMVYAKNIQPFGWYTVYINNIYLSTNGGTSFLFNKPIIESESKSIEDDNNNIIHKIINTFNRETVNKGRGVIVDSGTTDTYISSSIRDEFCTLWKKVTGGKEYSNGAMYLTQKQLKSLPTLLIQLQGTGPTAAGSTTEEQDDGYGNNNDDIIRPVIGQVGYLDVERWSDVLLSIPATSYMEYSPTLKVYVSRLFFTETRGGVLGANSMQGHNVLFDWQHSRIGFAQSSCNYDLIPNKNEKFAASANAAAMNNNNDDDDENDENDNSNNYNNCILNHEKPPILSQSCYESVILNNNIAICEASDNPTNVEISGYEIWTLQIEQMLHSNGGGGSDGSGIGRFNDNDNDVEALNLKDCENAIKEWSESQDTINSISDNFGGGGGDGDESVITNCNDGSGYAGLCQEYRPCHVPCVKAIGYNNKRRKRNNNGEETETGTTTDFTTDNGDADFYDETVTIPHDIIDYSHSSTTKKNSKNKTSTTSNHEADGTDDDDDGDDTEMSLSCSDWMWSVCDNSCHQSRIISKSKIVSTPTTETGRYCIESSRETRSCHVDECGRNDPCIVPFLVHAIFILEFNTTTGTTTTTTITNDDDDGSSGDGGGAAITSTADDTEISPTSASSSWVWTPQVEELFRKQLTLAAHNPDVVSLEKLLRLTKTRTKTTIEKKSTASPTLLFGEGDVNVLVARPWDDDDRDDDGTVNVGETKHNGDVNETPDNNNDNPSTVTGDYENDRERVRIQVIVQISISNPKAIRQYQQEQENRHHRKLLQEVGVIWSNFTNKVFRKSKPTSLCDPFDLYPLAKISNEVVDNIFSHPTFLSLLGDGMSPLLQNIGGVNTTAARSTTLSARLVSSWTIGTQIYDDYVNYLGPLASTPLFIIIKFFHETFLLILLGWLGLCLLKSIRLCRVCGIRIIKKYWNPNIYDPISQDDKEEEDNDNAVDDECCDSDVTYDDGIELTATYLRSKATKRRTSASKGS
jgi:hypothetical protein